MHANTSNCFKFDSKYTNPARGILEFCRQKFCRPLLSSQWTLYSMLLSDYYITQHTQDISQHTSDIAQHTLDIAQHM